jgi:flagellar hook-associated protein 1 FlgK
MPSLFSGINVALQSMLAHQLSVQVIEHNVANANTPGYRRQEVHLGTSFPYQPPGLYHAIQAGQIGTGVIATHIRRFNLEFFDRRYRQELGESQRWEGLHGSLQQIEGALAETSENGMLTDLDAFWSGWQSLSNDPTNMAMRAEIRSRGEMLASGINQRARALLDIQKDQNSLIIQDVGEINTIAQQIGALNAEIAHIQATNQQPNDLLDTRDQLLDQLANLAGAVSSVQDNGEVLVSIGGHALVVGDRTFSLETTPDPGNNNLAAITWEDGQALKITTGELAGRLEIRDTQIAGLQTKLNDFSASLINQVNALHQTGYGLNNDTGLDFFSGTDALSIGISSDISDLHSIASAAGPDSPGDGSIANQISGLQNDLLMSGGSQTLNQFYTDMVSSVGFDIVNANTKLNSRQLVLDSLNQQRESLAGVNLDEEAANLVKAQRAYQASARLVTVMDEMLDRVINGMGVVGR